MPTRDCPAYYHKEASRWMLGIPGTVSRYSSAEGNSIDYKFTSDLLNEPFVGFSTYGRSSQDVKCRLSRKVQIMPLDDTHGFEFKLEHSEDVRSPLPEDLITLTVVPLDPEGKLMERYIFFLLNQRYIDSPSNSRVAYYDKKTINEHEYQHVLELQATHRDRQTDITKMTLAKGHGLIQLEKSDGQVFNLESAK